MFNWFWRIVFWWKKRTGWLALDRVVEAAGVVISVNPPSADGDGCFDVALDAGYEWLITGFGGRLTGEGDKPPSLHCEIAPWAAADLKATYGRLKHGDHVRVSGAWGFDGVHTGRSMWIEVPLALVRHQPNVRRGWFEIHPVEKLEIVERGTP